VESTFIYEKEIEKPMNEWRELTIFGFQLKGNIRPNSDLSIHLTSLPLTDRGGL
jgi:hypothetical protein